MLLNRLLVLTVLVIAIAVTWRYRNSEFIQGLMSTGSHEPRKIIFDNGSVRDGISSEPAGNDFMKPVPVIGLRKCVRGTAVSYTDQPCPAGAREQSISKGTMTVMAGTRPAPPASAEKLQERRKTIRDVVDVDGTELRRRQMERVIEN
jgi:putative N-acetylmannosamine-6-phosphate epimerase